MAEGNLSRKKRDKGGWGRGVEVERDKKHFKALLLPFDSNSRKLHKT